MWFRSYEHFTNWPRPAGLMLRKPRPSKNAVTRASGQNMLTCIRMQNLTKSYEHVH